MGIGTQVRNAIQQNQQPPQQIGGKGAGTSFGSNLGGMQPSRPTPPQTLGGKGGVASGQPGIQRPMLGGGGAGGGGTLVGFGPTDAPIYSNDPNATPYTGPSMGGNYVNGVFQPRAPGSQPSPLLGGGVAGQPISPLMTNLSSLGTLGNIMTGQPTVARPSAPPAPLGGKGANQPRPTTQPLRRAVAPNLGGLGSGIGALAQNIAGKIGKR